MADDIEDARRMLTDLKATLAKIVDKDQEQEVRSVAVPVLDAALAQVREALPDNPVIAAVGGVISADTLAEGEPLRAVDVLVVVTAFLGALPPQQISRTAFSI